MLVNFSRSAIGGRLADTDGYCKCRVHFTVLDWPCLHHQELPPYLVKVVPPELMIQIEVSLATLSLYDIEIFIQLIESQ